MEDTSSHIGQQEAVARVRIGKAVTVRDEDNVWKTYVIADQRSCDAMRTKLAEGAVLTTRSELGRAILNAKVSEHREYESRDGEKKTVWIEAIEPGPVLWEGSKSRSERGTEDADPEPEAIRVRSIGLRPGRSAVPERV